MQHATAWSFVLRPEQSVAFGGLLHRPGSRRQTKFSYIDRRSNLDHDDEFLGVRPQAASELQPVRAQLSAGIGTASEVWHLIRSSNLRAYSFILFKFLGSGDEYRLLQNNDVHNGQSTTIARLVGHHQIRTARFCPKLHVQRRVQSDEVASQWDRFQVRHVIASHPSPRSESETDADEAAEIPKPSQPSSRQRPTISLSGRVVRSTLLAQR